MWEGYLNQILYFAEDDGRFAVHSGRTMASIEILRLLNYTSCDLAIV